MSVQQMHDCAEMVGVRGVVTESDVSLMFHELANIQGKADRASDTKDDICSNTGNRSL